MSGESVSAPAHNVIPLTSIQWVICVVATLAFATDLHETLMLPPIVRPEVTSVEKPDGRVACIDLWLGLRYCPLRLGKKGAGDANDGELSSL
jgi:hypothetical protein